MPISSPTSRRAFLRIAGGGVVIAASGFGLTQCDQMPSEAVAAWNTASASKADPRLWALSHALLAPNPHNLQSWTVDLSSKDEILLFVDQDRLLPHTDPFGRQIVIGQGTFLEILIQALAAQGYRADLTLFPEGAFPAEAIDARPVAHIKITQDSSIKADPLFAQVPFRRSNKEPYDTERPIEAAQTEALKRALVDSDIGLEITAATEKTENLRRLTGAAVLLEMETPRTHKESIDLVRLGAQEIAEHRDGIDLHGPMFWWLKRFGLMSKEKAMTPGTQAYEAGKDYAMGWAKATPSFGWITTQGNSRKDQIAAGRAYLRLNLAATAQGVAMHPVSQLLQEYPEMAELQQEFLTLVGAGPQETVQMLFRLGYAEAPAPSPRRNLKDLIRTA